MFKTLTALPSLQSLEVLINVAWALLESSHGTPWPRKALKQDALHKIANEKVWMRLRGSSLESLDVRLDADVMFDVRAVKGMFWAEDPKLVAFRDFVRGLVGVGS